MNLIKNRKFFIRSTEIFSIPCKLSSSDAIKQLNIESKALFGSVIKKESKRLNIINLPLSNNEPERNSEMYWMLQHKAQVKKFPQKVNSEKSTSKPPKLKESTKSRRNSKVVVDKPKSVSKELSLLKNKATKGIPNPIVIQPTPEIINSTDMNEIPFSEEDLKSLLKYPLYSNDSNIQISDNPIGHSKLPSVTRILQATMPESSREALMKWKVNKITELGEDGFAQYQKDIFKTGFDYHLSLQTYFRTKNKPTESSRIYNLWNSVSTELENINDNPQLVEASVAHPILKYKGIVDCVSIVGKNLTAIEWKHSDKHKITIHSTYDAPLQLCAYLGALNADPQYNLNLKKGLIVVAYLDGSPANAYQLNEIDLKRYWRAWVLRVQEYWIRYRDGTIPENI